VLKDIMQTIRAVAGKPKHKCSKCGHEDPAVAGIPLSYKITEDGEAIPLLEVNMKIPTYLAKRLGRADIAIPGCEGERDFGYRVSTKEQSYAAPSASTESGPDW
jgi:hypothetical protein